eukprot:UN26253
MNMKDITENSGIPVNVAWCLFGAAAILGCFCGVYIKKKERNMADDQDVYVNLEDEANSANEIICITE